MTCASHPSSWHISVDILKWSLSQSYWDVNFCCICWRFRPDATWQYFSGRESVRTRAANLLCSVSRLQKWVTTCSLLSSPCSLLPTLCSLLSAPCSLRILLLSPEQWTLSASAVDKIITIDDDVRLHTYLTAGLWTVELGSHLLPGAAPADMWHDCDGMSWQSADAVTALGDVTVLTLHWLAVIYESDGDLSWPSADSSSVQLNLWYYLDASS